MGTQGMRQGHLTSVLKKEKEQILGGVRKGALGADQSRVESELQPTQPFPVGPIGPTEKHPSSCPHRKAPPLHLWVILAAYNSG